MTTTKAKAKGDRAVTAEQLKEAVRAYADAHFPGWGLATLGIDGGTGQLGASETLLVLNADGSTKRVWARGVKPGHRAGDAVPGSETPADRQLAAAE